MMASMAVFGLGGESLSVAQKTTLASWFRDSKGFPKLAFATGLTLTFGYIVRQLLCPVILCARLTRTPLPAK